jgi:hypothetical protein
MKKTLFLTISIITIFQIVSCSKKDEPTSTGQSQSPTSFYFKGKLGDSTFTLYNDVNYVYSGFNQNSQVYAEASTNYNRIVKFDEGSMWSRVDYTIFPTPSPDYYIFMSYNKVIDIADDNYNFPTISDLDNIYTVGKSTLFSVEAASTSNYNSDGWQITVYDSKGEIWSTFNANSNQSSSYVNILSRNNVNIPNAGAAYCIKGDLSCTVYNSSGQSKVFTGEFYEIVSDYSKIY